MSDTAILSLYRTLQTGFVRTQNALSSVLPAAGAAFNPILNVLSTEISAITLKQIEQDFHFNGPTSAELMRCYNLACDLHRINPHQFPAPPTLARPPVVDTPVTVNVLQDLYRLNCQSLPETLTYTVPGYELTLARAMVTHCSVLDLYGSQVRNTGGNLPLHLTEDEAKQWLQSHMTDTLVTDAQHWKRAEWFDEHVVAVEILNEAMVADTTVPSGLARRVNQYAVTCRRAKQSHHIPDDYVWTWMKLRYDIEDEAPHLVEDWIPVGNVEPVVEEVVVAPARHPDPVAVTPPKVETPTPTPAPVEQLVEPHETHPDEQHTPMTLEAYAHHQADSIMDLLATTSGGVPEVKDGHR